MIFRNGEKYWIAHPPVSCFTKSLNLHVVWYDPVYEKWACRDASKAPQKNRKKNANLQISMPEVGFQLTIPMLVRQKALHALDAAIIVFSDASKQERCNVRATFKL